jgi:hypothetical protein
MHHPNMICYSAPYVKPCKYPAVAPAEGAFLMALSGQTTEECTAGELLMEESKLQQLAGRNSIATALFFHRCAKIYPLHIVGLPPTSRSPQCLS